MKEGSSVPKCLGLLKTLGYKRTTRLLTVDLEAMAGYQGHRHGLEEAHMEQCFFSYPNCAGGLDTLHSLLFFKSEVSGRNSQCLPTWASRAWDNFF